MYSMKKVGAGFYYTSQVVRTKMDVPKLEVELCAITSAVRDLESGDLECLLGDKHSVVLIFHGLRDGFDDAVNDAARRAVLDQKSRSISGKVWRSMGDTPRIPEWTTEGRKSVYIILGVGPNTGAFVDILESWGQRTYEVLDQLLEHKSPPHSGRSCRRRIGKWIVNV
jgi:hypothetical protein